MAFLARFMTVYAAVIAVTKDLVDIEGDRKGGIETFAMRRMRRRGSNANLCTYWPCSNTSVFGRRAAQLAPVGSHTRPPRCCC